MREKSLTNYKCFHLRSSPVKQIFFCMRFDSIPKHMFALLMIREQIPI